MPVDGYVTPQQAPNPFGGSTSNMFGNTSYPIDLHALAKFGGWDWTNIHAGMGIDSHNKIAAAQRGAKMLAENMNLPAVESVRNKQANTEKIYSAFGLDSKKGQMSNAMRELLGMVDDDGGSANINASSGTGAGADYQQLYNQLSALMRDRGGSYEADIRQSAEEAANTAAARMQSRGLGGSTLIDASNARINRDKNSALNKLHDTLLGQDIGTLTNVGVEGLKAKQRQSEFSAQMKLANSGRGMQLLQTLLGG